jgi:hypothetical protein
VRRAALCLSLAIVSGPLAARAESASDVIERYLAAIGGKKAVEKIVSTEVSGRVTSADGRSGIFTQQTERPRLFYQSLSWGDSRWRAGFNGRATWQDDNVDGLRTLYGHAASRLRAESTYANTRFALSDKVEQFILTTQDRVRSQPLISLAAITSDGTKRTLFFDAKSYLLVKDEQQTDAGVEERLFDDYRRVDQVLEPHRIEWHRNGETLVIAVERITHNAPLNEHVFDIPAAPTEPRLDLDAVLSKATVNELQMDARLATYMYTQSDISERMDEQGRVTAQEGSTYEIVHLGDMTVRKLVKNRGGRALSEAERLREDERVNTLAREYERRRASGQLGRGGHYEHRSPGLATVWVPLMGGDWLQVYQRMCDFSGIRRERVQGRAAVVVEFQPKRNAAPMDDLEHQAVSTAGTLWIDEASQSVIRFESYFRDEYDRTVPGSSIRYERTLVNDDAWLPSRSEINRRVRFAFGHSSYHLGTLLFTDHKKFSVESRIVPTNPGR